MIAKLKSNFAPVALALLACVLMLCADTSIADALAVIAGR